MGTELSRIATACAHPKGVPDDDELIRPVSLSNGFQRSDDLAETRRADDLDERRREIMLQVALNDEMPP